MNADSDLGSSHGTKASTSLQLFFTNAGPKDPPPEAHKGDTGLSLDTKFEPLRLLRLLCDENDR
jgi:hypothetical protein